MASVVLAKLLRAGEQKQVRRLSSIADYVEDVASLVEALPTGPVVIGHSMGGYIVQKYLESQAAPAGVLLASMPPRGALRFVGRDQSVVLSTEGLGKQRFHGKIVLLVNEHSASSCEMVAAFAQPCRGAEQAGDDRVLRRYGLVSHGARMLGRAGAVNLRRRPQFLIPPAEACPASWSGNRSHHAVRATGWRDRPSPG